MKQDKIEINMDNLLIYGYARVSTSEQNLDLQIDALKSYGASHIVSEKISGTKERQELEKLLKRLKKGDILAVWKLDRLGRSIRHLVELIERFNKEGVHFISLQEGINTTTAQGRLFFHIIAALAEFERGIIKERTHAGLKAARERGRKGGRPKGLSIESHLKAQQAKLMYDSRKYPISEITLKLKISKPTLYRYIKLT